MCNQLNYTAIYQAKDEKIQHLLKDNITLTFRLEEITKELEYLKGSRQLMTNLLTNCKCK